MKLQGKVAVITGGNSGIGFGIAESFKNEGAIGTIVGRTQETLDSSVAQLGESFIGINADVTNHQDLERIFKETFDTYGEIDILVANAGGAARGATMGSVADITESDYDKTMDLNLKSVFFTVNKAIPYLKEGASIVLIGSSSAHHAYPSLSLYGSAKAAVISFARGFSLDLLDRKIRVNVLSPGTTETPVYEKSIPAEYVVSVKKWFVDGIPLGRIGQPSDMGKAAVFLASDDSAFMLGNEILFDGGATKMTLMT